MAVPKIGKPDFSALLKLAESRFYAWHLKEIVPERERRIRDLQTQNLTFGGRTFYTMQIYRELLEREVRERISLYAGVARDHRCSEMLSKSRIEECRERVMTSVDIALSVLRDRIERAAFAAADIRPSELPPQRRYMSLKGQILSIVNTELGVLAAEGELLGHAADGRRGYRAEVREWMRAQGLRTNPEAASRLGVSVDILKSIMSSKGQKRYSDHTLQTVLKKIGATK